MITALVSLYIKLNLILVMAFLSWMSLCWLAKVMNFRVSKSQELIMGRIFFMSCLAVPVIFSMMNMPLAKVTGLIEIIVVGQYYVGGIDVGLRNEIAFLGQEVSVAILVSVLLGIGISMQIYKETKKWGKLKKIISNSILWKKINKVSVVFSQEVSTPFSTRALGGNLIVLPYQLLESPENFRLAVKHELQHMRSRDLSWVLLLDMIKPVFFWNPAYYGWHNEFHCLQEYACDEALLERPTVNAKVYGQCLLEVASYPSLSSQFASSNMVQNFTFFARPQSQLKRRIMMMTRNTSSKFQALKISIYAGALTLVLAGCSMNMMAAVEEENVVAMPTSTVAPDYPQEALTKGIEGWVVVEFTVDANGAVEQPTVLGSCYGRSGGDRETVVENCVQDNVFDRSAILAIEQYKFERLSSYDGNNMRYKFEYKIQP